MSVRIEAARNHLRNIDTVVRSYKVKDRETFSIIVELVGIAEQLTNLVEELDQQLNTPQETPKVTKETGGKAGSVN